MILKNVAKVVGATSSKGFCKLEMFSKYSYTITLEVYRSRNVIFTSVYIPNDTRSPAIAEAPRDAGVPVEIW